MHLYSSAVMQSIDGQYMIYSSYGILVKRNLKISLKKKISEQINFSFQTDKECVNILDAIISLSNKHLMTNM